MVTIRIFELSFLEHSMPEILLHESNDQGSRIINLNIFSWLIFLNQFKLVRYTLIEYQHWLREEINLAPNARIFPALSGL